MRVSDITWRYMKILFNLLELDEAHIFMYYMKRAIYWILMPISLNRWLSEQSHIYNYPNKNAYLIRMRRCPRASLSKGGAKAFMIRIGVGISCYSIPNCISKE
jgi:hypothetical protein